MSIVATLFSTLVCSGLSFVPASIEGLGPTPSPGFNRRDHFTAIHARLSNGRQPDLLTATHVYFAHDDHYVADERTSYPQWDLPGAVDAWGDKLYARQAGRLLSYRWSEGAWNVVIDQAITWPDEGRHLLPAVGAAARAIRFERFLYDLYGDSRPEVVLLGPEGLMVYALEGDRYALQETWDLLPAPRRQPAAEVALWPRKARRLTLPGWEQAARVLVEPAQLRVIVREHDGQHRTRYRQLRYALSSDETTPQLVEDYLGAPLDLALRPVRLNKTPALQLAGVGWEAGRGRAMTPPRIAYTVSLDGGETVQGFRAAVPPGWRVRAPAVDWDGDGRLDLLVQHTHLYEGGVRESLARMLTRSAVDHSVAIHRQTAEGFESEARVKKRVTLALDRPPFRPCSLFEDYRSGARLSLAGDFDGDGWRDLVVRRDANKLDIYLTREESFAAGPDHTLDIFADEQFAITDLNENGKSDLVFYVPGQGGATAARARVFFARGLAP